MHYFYKQIWLVVMFSPSVFSVPDDGLMITAAVARIASSTLDIFRQTDVKNKRKKFFIEVANQNLK